MDGGLDGGGGGENARRSLSVSLLYSQPPVQEPSACGGASVGGGGGSPRPPGLARLLLVVVLATACFPAVVDDNPFYPQELRWFSPQHAAEYNTLISSGWIGLSAMLVPLIGTLADAHFRRGGSRRRFICAAMVVSLAGLVGKLLTLTWGHRSSAAFGLFIVSRFVAMTGPVVVSVSFAAVYADLSKRIPENVVILQAASFVFFDSVMAATTAAGLAMLVTRDNHGFYCVQIGLAVLVVACFGVFVPPQMVASAVPPSDTEESLLGTSADVRSPSHWSALWSSPRYAAFRSVVVLRGVWSLAESFGTPLLYYLEDCTSVCHAVRFNTKIDLASQIVAPIATLCAAVLITRLQRVGGHARGLCVLGAIGLLGNAAASAIQPFLRNGAVIFWVPIVNVVFESLMELVFIMLIFASIPFETATRDYAILLSIEEVEASVFQLLNEPFLAMPFFRQPGLVHNSTTATACDDAAHTSSSSHPARAVKYTRLMYQILGGIPAAFYVAAACIFLVVARRLEKAAAAAGHHRSGTVRQGGGDGSGVGGTAAGAPCVGGKHTAGV